jgi:hypothetical protein
MDRDHGKRVAVQKFGVIRMKKKIKVKVFKGIAEEKVIAQNQLPWSFNNLIGQTSQPCGDTLNLPQILLVVAKKVKEVILSQAQKTIHEVRRVPRQGPGGS